MFPTPFAHLSSLSQRLCPLLPEVRLGGPVAAPASRKPRSLLDALHSHRHQPTLAVFPGAVLHVGALLQGLLISVLDGVWVASSDRTTLKNPDNYAPQLRNVEETFSEAHNKSGNSCACLLCIGQVSVQAR